MERSLYRLIWPLKTNLMHSRQLISPISDASDGMPQQTSEENKLGADEISLELIHMEHQPSVQTYYHTNKLQLVVLDELPKSADTNEHLIDMPGGSELHTEIDFELSFNKSN